MSVKTKKKLFSNTRHLPKRYVRKLVRQGASMVLAVSKVVPSDWRIVEIERIEKGNDYVIVKITRLV